MDMDWLNALIATSSILALLLPLAVLILWVFLIWRFIRATDDIRVIRKEVEAIRDVTESDYDARYRAAPPSAPQNQWTTGPTPIPPTQPGSTE